MPDNPVRKPVMIVLAGPNGSGKTTIAEQLRAHAWSAGTVYVNPDEIARDEFGSWNNRRAILKSQISSKNFPLAPLSFASPPSSKDFNSPPTEPFGAR